MATEMTPAEMVEMYIKLRDYKKLAQEEFDKSMERTKAGMAKLESMLLAHLNENELENIKSTAGTAYKKTEYSASVDEPVIFKEWLDATGQWGAADIRANKKYVRELADKGEVVPGIKLSSIITVGIRRS